MNAVEKDEILEVLCALVIAGKTGFQQFQLPETSRKVWRKQDTLSEGGLGKGTFKQIGQDRAYRSPWDLMGCTHKW